jgi:hypothetical protein
MLKDFDIDRTINVDYEVVKEGFDWGYVLRLIGKILLIYLLFSYYIGIF